MANIKRGDDMLDVASTVGNVQYWGGTAGDIINDPIFDSSSKQEKKTTTVNKPKPKPKVETQEDTSTKLAQTSTDDASTETTKTPKVIPLEQKNVLPKGFYA